MKSIYILDEQQHATVLAALRVYQEQGMGNPENRSDAIHDIATNIGEVTSLDDAGIESLIGEMNEPIPYNTRISELSDLLLAGESADIWNDGENLDGPKPAGYIASIQAGMVQSAALLKTQWVAINELHAAASGICLQIRQMSGLFDDDDRCIANALENAEIALGISGSLTGDVPKFEEAVQQILAALKRNGMTFSDCINAFGAHNGDDYVIDARRLAKYYDFIEVDQTTVSTPSTDGRWVMAWLLIKHEDAGLLGNPELLEKVLDSARAWMVKNPPGDTASDTASQDSIYADWLEDLIGNYADELDTIEAEIPSGVPGTITWTGVDHIKSIFKPSDAIFRLLQLAKQNGLNIVVADQAEDFSARYGQKLDAILTSIQTDALVD